MIKLISILLLSLLPFQALADDANFLQKGQPAPYDGFLLDRDKATKVRLLDIDYQEALKNTEYLKKDNELFQQRVDNLQTYNTELAKQNADLRSSGLWINIGFFTLGVAASVAIAFGISRVTR